MKFLNLFRSKNKISRDELALIEAINENYQYFEVSARSVRLVRPECYADKFREQSREIAMLIDAK